jgi:hypothetical protein
MQEIAPRPRPPLLFSDFIWMACLQDTLDAGPTPSLISARRDRHPAGLAEVRGRLELGRLKSNAGGSSEKDLARRVEELAGDSCRS